MEITQRDDGTVVFNDMWSAQKEEFNVYKASVISSQYDGYYALSENPDFGSWDLDSGNNSITNPSEFSEVRGLYIYAGSDISAIEDCIVAAPGENRPLSEFNE